MILIVLLILPETEALDQDQEHDQDHEQDEETGSRRVVERVL